MSNDPVIQRARLRLEALEAERRELEAFLGTYAKLAGTAASVLEKAIRHHVVSMPEASRRTSNTQKILDGVSQVLRAHGQPMRLKDILAALQLIGIEVPGKVPANNLGAMLSTAKNQFVTTPGVGWWFKDDSATKHVNSAENLQVAAE